MDAEILSGRLAATEEALLKIDARLDEIAGKVDAWQTQNSLNSEGNQIAELAAAVAIAESEARVAEAEAVEAMAEAQEAEAEAFLAVVEESQPEPEPEPEVEAPQLEVIEAPEVSEKPPSENPPPKRNSDLEDLGLR